MPRPFGPQGEAHARSHAHLIFQIALLRQSDRPLMYLMLNIKQEIVRHQRASLTQHPHILEFHEVFATPTYIGLVTEHVEGEQV